MTRALGVLALLLAGCAVDPVTEIVVVVSSDLPADQIAGMRISVKRASNGDPLFDKCTCVGNGPGCAALPVTLGLVPEGSLEHPFTVAAAAYADASCGQFVVTQSATLQFYARHTLELDLALLQICRNKVCDPGSTCYDDGQCRSDQRSGLPDFDPNRDGGTTTGPPPRLLSAMAYDPVRKRTVMFGGQAAFNTESILGDTWEWDGTRWTPGGGGDVPVPRFAGSMVFDPMRGKLVLYGGTYKTDTYTYDGTWTNISSTVGDGPTPEYPLLVWDSQRNRILLYGEDDDVTYALGAGGRWAMVPTAHSPGRRGVASMAYFPPTGQAVLFGGSASNGDVGDTWRFDGSDWMQLMIPGPMQQTGTAMAYDERLGTLVMYARGETWEGDGASWTKDMIVGPPSRSAEGVAYDSDRGVVVLFGGMDGNNTSYNDTWELGDDRVWRQR